MSDLPVAGAEAPAFSLTDRQGATLAFDGGGAAGATLLFFFKHDCATCELTAPLVERLHRALGPHGLRVAGVSQDPEADTAGFVDRHGLGFDVALDGRPHGVGRLRLRRGAGPGAGRARPAGFATASKGSPGRTSSR